MVPILGRVGISAESLYLELTFGVKVPEPHPHPQAVAHRRIHVTCTQQASADGRTHVRGHESPAVDVRARPQNVRGRGLWVGQ